MEEFYPIIPPQPQFFKDIGFYRQVAYSLSMLGGRQVRYAYGANLLSMSVEQLSYCDSFYRNTYFRPMMAEELMLLDGYCELIRGSATSVSPDEVLMNDSYIADTYARLMSTRKSLDPDYNTHATVSDIFEVATEAIRSEGTKSFNPSDVGVFTSFSDTEAEAVCLSEGYEPLKTANGVCVGSRRISKERSAYSGTALIYLNGGDPALFSSLLSSPVFSVSTVAAELCKTERLFTRLTELYDNFSINTSTLPLPRSSQYANQPLIYNEIFTVQIAGAFLTKDIFGETVLAVHGSRSELNRVCSMAKKLGLSYFNGISADVTEQKSRRMSVTPMIVWFRSSLYRILAELSDNIKIKLPDHDLSGSSVERCIPNAERVFGSESDSVFSAVCLPDESPPPFHSALYSILSPLVSAASDGVNLQNGSFSLSVSARLSFEDEMRSGSSLSALLGLYRAQSELSLPFFDSRIELASGTPSVITVALHGHSVARDTLEIGASSVSKLLADTANEFGLPDFDLIKKLISGKNL